MNDKPYIAVWLDEKATEEDKRKVKEMLEQETGMRFKRRDEMTPRERADALIERIRRNPHKWIHEFSLEIEQAINTAVEDEREACAELARKVRFGTSNEWIRQTSTDIEALIRARSSRTAE